MIPEVRRWGNIKMMSCYRFFPSQARLAIVPALGRKEPINSQKKRGITTVPRNAVLMLGCGGPRNLHLEKQLPLSGGNRYEGRQKPLFFLPFVFLLLGLDLSSGMRSLQ